MKRFLHLVIAAALAAAVLAAPAAAELSGDYTYYRVQEGDTLDGIATRLKVDVAAIVALNQGLRTGDKTLAEHVFLFVPKPAPKARPRKEEPKPAAEEPKEAASDELDLTPEEEELIAELMEKDVPDGRYSVGADGEIQVRGLPEHRNVMRTSDGKVIAVPTAPPKPEVQDARHRRQLASRAGKIGALLGTAKKWMGVPYVFGGCTRQGVDCSAYVQNVYAAHGVSLPRTADVQYERGRRVARGKEQPGDLVFFETYCPGASHVGIYIGKRRFIHASSKSGQVTINNLDDQFYQARYLGGKRVF